MIRLPTRHDPLTVDEQADLDCQLGKMFDQNLPSYHMLASQLDNVGRLHATLQFYRNLIAEMGRDVAKVDEALPRRVIRNGIAYLFFTDPNDSPRCIAFGADPDLKPGPLTQDDRGWKPEDDER